MDTPADAEWLEADGQGGFASGTADTIRTRRYHALLLAAATPTRRLVLVNGVEAWVETEAGRFALNSHLYAPDTVWPDGARHIVHFTAHPWPTWRFVLPDGTEISHEIIVSRATAETVLRWNADRAVRLVVRPLLSGRDYHALHHENPAFDFTTARHESGVAWTPYAGLPEITARGGFAWTDDPVWFRHFLYSVERARGMDDREDLASPGVFSWDVPAYGPAATLILRAGPAGTAAPDALAAEERKRRSAQPADPAWPATSCYIAHQGPRRMVLAGFPWFGVWGRDTFIAMRGLLLARGHLVLAADILLAWADMVSEGMLPNRFPDGEGAPEYNAVDASLWFVIVVHELIAAGGASRAVTQRLQGAALAILQGYTAGTRFGIAADPADGLLRAGVPGQQLTWMDAKVDGHVITPRIGKPVEVQALWINALAIAGQWPDGDRWVGPALRARDNFVARFVDRETGGLIDVLDADGLAGRVDRSVRPNQILAAGGLPIPVLTPLLARRVVALVERDLLTPLGLRTLSPADPAYRGRYAGDVVQRDGAYHQGTAWPWLLGPFVAAWLASHGDTPDVRAEGRARFLPPLHAHLHTAGLGHVSEVVDGDAPHTPGGCPFQAWSLGELIRIERMLQDPVQHSRS